MELVNALATPDGLGPSVILASPIILVLLVPNARLASRALATKD
jgi:hypothetical protein